MKNLYLRYLVVAALTTTIFSCSKDDQTQPKSISSNLMAAAESTASFPLQSIDTISRWYLATSKIELKKYLREDWNHNVVYFNSIANNTLKIDFNMGMTPLNSLGYFWGVTPYVECNQPIFIMGQKEDNLNMHLSKKVNLFGFELSTQAGSAFEITVSYYDSSTGMKVGTLVKRVLTSHGGNKTPDDTARMFAVNSTVPFDEVHITMTKTFNPVFTSPGKYQLANFHYALAN
jgi:hypothetical protein